MLSKTDLESRQKANKLCGCERCLGENKVVETALSLMAERDSMREMLNQLEWSYPHLICPICKQVYGPHKPDCALAKLLEEVKEE